jgi:DNA-binding MarR family transcriptional regulator
MSNPDRDPLLSGAEEGESQDDLIDAVLLASRAVVAIAARSLSAAPAHITLPQYRVLVMLATRGPQFPSVLASELRLAPSSVTRLCDRLAAKGLILRAEAPDSRRQVVVTISAAGRRVVDTVTAVRRCEIGRLVTAVPAARRLQTIEALNDLSAAAGEEPDRAWLPGWSE